MQHVVLVGNVADRLKQKSGVLNERNQRAQTQRVTHDAITAVPDNQRDAHRADEVDERKKDRIVEDRFDVRIAMLVVDLGKAGQ